MARGLSSNVLAWLAFAGLMLRAGRATPGGAAPFPSQGAPSSGLPGEVAATPTPAGVTDVQTAIILAYTQKRGHSPPREESWLWPLALSAFETGYWQNLYNFNAGNVIFTVPPGGPWYRNPHVLASTGLTFRSFDGLVQGARAMLDALDSHGGLSAADAGDLGAFQTALNGYLGSGTYPDLEGTIQALSHLVS